MEKEVEKLTANYDARMEAIKAAKLEEAQKLLAEKARKVGVSSRHTLVRSRTYTVKHGDDSLAGQGKSTTVMFQFEGADTCIRQTATRWMDFPVCWCERFLSI